MGSPAAILTIGLGSWGSASELLTLGYGLGEAAVETPHEPPAGVAGLADRAGVSGLADREGVWGY